MSVPVGIIVGSRPDSAFAETEAAGSKVFITMAGMAAALPGMAAAKAEGVLAADTEVRA